MCWCYTGLAHWIHHPMLRNASVRPGQYHVAGIGQLCCETGPLQWGRFRRVMNMLLLGVQSCLFRSDHCLFFRPGLWCGSCVSVLPVYRILWFIFGRIQEGLWLFSWWFELTASLAGGWEGTLPSARMEGVVFSICMVERCSGASLSWSIRGSAL